MLNRVKRVQQSAIIKDTIILTGISLGLQGLSLLLNIYITKTLGTSAVGITSLIFSFFTFAIILSNGNIFTSTSRFVSEEIGKGKAQGNVHKIVGYALLFGVLLSLSFGLLIFILAPIISKDILKSSEATSAIRLLAIALPLATVGSCLKGYFHAIRLIKKPCVADVLEFMIKLAVVAVFVTFLIPQGKASILMAIAISLALGELSSCIYLCVSYIKDRRSSRGTGTVSIPSFGKYICAILPIAVSGYIFVVLSSANEALVPITLMRFSGSVEVALSEYGIFEAIIMPVIFFPAIILQSLSCILVPEIAREQSAHNERKVKYLTSRVVQQGFMWAFFIVVILFCCGEQIGMLMCDDPLAGRTLKLLCPVIPFIYLEILLEGILKGLGKQGFSTINSAVEYILRISAVLIFVPLIGFYGIVVSYFVSNIVCNITRIIATVKATKIKFDFMRFLFAPMFSALLAWQISKLVMIFLTVQNEVVNTGINIVIVSLTYYVIVKGIEKAYSLRQ